MGIYHPIARDQQYPVDFAIRVAGNLSALVPEVRRIAAEVDPTLRVSSAMSLTDVVNDDLRFVSFWLGLVRTVSAVALLLSLTGIYAVTSYIVSRRTREIGVRVALGASGRQIVTSILRRPLRQVAFGILIGTIMTALMAGAISIEGLRTQPAVGLLMKLSAVALYGAFMLAVCLLACIVPTRRRATHGLGGTVAFDRAFGRKSVQIERVGGGAPSDSTFRSAAAYCRRTRWGPLPTASSIAACLRR
jgi:predicted lysophospholipase L1 biosynthesis ABC-type transport system permease subunit